MIFDRQIAFWGEKKQDLLRRSCVFVAGIGGLGCLLSEVLVRSGVGRVYLCDNGIVDAPDLNRQLFYTQKDIGRKKIHVAAAWLSKIHNHTQVIPLYEDVMNEDFTLPMDIDGVADCLDNFEGRFALWGHLRDGLFWVHSGVEEFFGQVLTLIKGRSPGLQEVFANHDDRKRTIPVSANSAAVISALASTEVINNIFMAPKLHNTYLIIDLSDFTFSKITLFM